LNRFKTGGATPGVWHSAEAHEGVMKAIGYALIERYPDHLDTNKLVMVTVANEAFQELLMNWLAFTRARDVPVLVGALDDATFERCGAMSVPAVQLQHAGFDTTLVSLDEHSVKNKDFRSSQRGFQNYGVRKLAFLLTLLELGLDVSLSDTDVVWQKRYVPLRVFKRRTAQRRETDKTFPQQPRRFVFRKERHVYRCCGCTRHV